MKIRNVNALLLTVLLFGAVASCDSGSKSKEERLDDLMDRADEAKAKSYYADAVDYHQAIIGLHTQVGVQLMKMSEAEQLEEYREEIKILRELIIANHEALKNISFTSSESGNFAFVDYGLKSAMLDLFSFYQEIIENEYQEIGVIWNRMEQNQNDEELLMSLSMRLIEIHTGIQKKEREIDNAVKSASDKFALAFNIQLEENPLAEDLNEAIDETEAWKEELKDIYDTQ